MEHMVGLLSLDDDSEDVAIADPLKASPTLHVRVQPVIEHA